METSEEGWYIVKKEAEECQILSAQALNSLEGQSLQRWGPFKSQGQAIAKRVGLIRAGKCRPE